MTGEGKHKPGHATPSPAACLHSDPGPIQTSLAVWLWRRGPRGPEINAVAWDVGGGVV